VVRLIGLIAARHRLQNFTVFELQGSVESEMGYLTVLAASGGLAVAEVFILEPALKTEDPLLLEADVLEVGSVGLIAGRVLLQAH
jgi:hypothetical protein